METANILRLSIIKDQLILQYTKAKELSEDVTLEPIMIEHNKLRTINNRFANEVQNYCNTCTQPSNNIIEEYTNLQLKTEQLIAELDVKINRKERMQKETVTQETENTSLSKLPTIELAKFDGDVLQWQEFWDRFSSNIDSRNIKEVDKLLYLKSILLGEAKQTIEGLEVTNQNYKIAIQTLTERYGKKGYLIDAHYMALNNMRRAEETPKDCRIVLNDIERHLRILKSLGENVNNNNFRITIFDKFPKDILYELRIKIDPEEESVDVIRKHLDHIISAKEASYRLSERTKGDNFTTEALHVNSIHVNKNHWGPRGKEECNENQRGFGRGDRKRYGSAFNRKRQESSSDDQERRQTKFRKLTCIFCQGEHYCDECPKYKTIKQRKERLAGRCYICLKEGHNAKQCRNKRKCHHCGSFGDHNRALCPKWSVNSKETTINSISA